MTIQYFAAVDPGKTGYYALIAKNNASTYFVEGFHMPLTKEKDIDSNAIVYNLERWLELYGTYTLILEKQMCIQGQGLSSSFTTGINFGLLKGICIGMKIPYKVVTAKTWQKIYPDCDIPEDIAKLNIKDSKKKSLAVCSKLFPDVNLQTKRKKYLDCISDAILMANFSINY